MKSSGYSRSNFLRERTILDSALFSIYPIAWILKSGVVMDFMREADETEPSDERRREFLVADYAAGEHDRISSFFIKILHEIDSVPNTIKRATVYCIDLHALRLDSLLGKLEESHLLDRARVVQARLESMDLEAIFRPDMIEYLNQNPTEITWLDRDILLNKRIQSESFDIGILNNDVVGYLHEYYKEYSNAALALKQVFQTIRSGGLLIVTMPCSLYVVDNVAVLESVGFKFIEGVDIDLDVGKVSIIDRNVSPRSISKLNHYSFLVFSRV
ncbi:MAG: hypothetical protein ACFFE3_13835 [Candidatus Thorarchaeota archaeon]